jgi:mannose-6-phosphate isomerase
MDKISILKNPVQAYDWGSRTEIQKIIGDRGSSGKSMAELWMGAHPKAPSQVMIKENWLTLDKAIEEDPESILGKRVAERFSNKLPFLFKVLASEKPLSLQVHPNRKQAREGFHRENRMAIPLDGANRNYKDCNHKPEILCALTPFIGLMGFRPVEDILALFDMLTPSSTLSDKLNPLIKRPDSHGLMSFFSSLMEDEKPQQQKIAGEAARYAEKYTDQDQAFFWVKELNRYYPGDIGILSPIILNLVRLEPKEAVYIPAGEPHAYLHGLGIELMANSDNVLRGGLTPKHIDIKEFLSIIDFHPRPARKVDTVKTSICRTIYKTPAKEFEVSVISIDKNNPFTSATDRNVEIIICLEGTADIIDVENGEALAVFHGMSFIVPSVVTQYRIEGDAVLYMAYVPD